jgi:hypothetical protein
MGSSSLSRFENPLHWVVLSSQGHRMVLKESATGSLIEKHTLSNADPADPNR